MPFKVVARRAGDAVEFLIEDTNDPQAALAKAKAEAKRIFGAGPDPSVSVKMLSEE